MGGRWAGEGVVGVSLGGRGELGGQESADRRRLATVGAWVGVELGGGGGICKDRSGAGVDLWSERNGPPCGAVVDEGRVGGGGHRWLVAGGGGRQQAVGGGGGQGRGREGRWGVGALGWRGGGT